MKFLKYLLKTVLIIVFLICPITYGLFFIVNNIHDKVAFEKNDSNYYTYAIIFYPDKKTSVEGYVDKFIWGTGIVKVTIDGEEYTTSPENCVIVKRKDLVVNKEVDE